MHSNPRLQCTPEDGKKHPKRDGLPYYVVVCRDRILTSIQYEIGRTYGYARSRCVHT